MARLESQDNPKIVHALLAGKLLTFSSLATATGIPTTTLDRRLKALMDAGIVSYYEPAGSYGLSRWLRAEKLGFTTALDLLERGDTAVDSFRIYTIGYEGKTPKSLAETLFERKIERLVDVREVANSRKAGFSAGALGGFLRTYAIEYVHLPGLGSPHEARRRLHLDNDFESFSKDFESYLDGREDDLNDLVGLAVEKPTAIMCFEKDSSKCHRSIITGRLSRIGFEITNLH